jgi:predicted secreted protein
MWMTVALAATLAVLWCSGNALSADPKYSIKEVMKLAHSGKPALCTKAVQGKATPEEKKQLLELYEALAANKPPRGSEQAWKERTTALVEAAKALVANDKDAIAKYKKALNCAGCHKEHKPS